MPVSRVDTPFPGRVTLRWLLRAILMAAAIALAAMPDARTEAQGHAVTEAVSGEFAQSNSRSGSTIFRASNFAPGGATSGSVRIGNTGRRSGHFVLAQGLLVDRVGRYRGRLASQLDLVLEEVRANGAARVLYRGKLSGLEPRYLGVFQPRESRTYHFFISFPQGDRPASVSTGDNRFAGSNVRAEYDWVSYDSRPAMRNYVPPNRPGPRVRLSTYRIEDALRMRSFTLMVRCNERCRLRGGVRIDGKSARASRPLAKFSRLVRANRMVRVRIKLTRRSRRRIIRQFRKRRRARVIVEVRATNRLGAVTIKRVRIHLKPVRKRSKR